MTNKTSLTGRRYLVVEDEYLVALHLCSELEDVGARIVGPISSVEGALRYLDDAEDAPDGAVLDLNLRGTMGYAIADRLLELGLPFVFVTGYDCDTIPARYKDVPCFTKPCSDQALLARLAALPHDGPRHGLRMNG